MIAIEKGKIARWKIDTPFENWLGKKAENSEFYKKLYCGYYRIFDREYYKKGVKMAKDILTKWKVDIDDSIIRDMIFCLHRYGFTFYEYFVLGICNKNSKGREEYIADKMRYEYYYMMNSEKGNKLLRDKGKTYELFQKYFKRKCAPIYDEKDESKFNEFVSQVNKFIYKPIGKDCGKGVQILLSAECNFNELIKSGPFIVEELINQSEIMASFHKESVNTIRIPTVLCNDGVHIINPCFRMGRGNSIVDNAGSGGIFAAVDKETGIVYSKAVSEYGDEEYIKHPDSQKIIIGFQIPDWQQLIEIVKDAATVLPEMRYVAWDFAHTDKGWVLVEANGSGQFIIQMADKIGRKKELLSLISKK